MVETPLSGWGAVLALAGQGLDRGDADPTGDAGALPLVGVVRTHRETSSSGHVVAGTVLNGLCRSDGWTPPRFTTRPVSPSGAKGGCPTMGQGGGWFMTSNPSYEQSKQIAEASRETEWTKPSFGKELFLGNFRLDLIHPQPELDPAAVEKGEAFLERLRAFLVECVDSQQIEREAKIPEDVIRGLKDLGALGMKIPEEYGGLGLSQVYYNKALAMVGTWHSSLGVLLSAHQSIGLGEPLRLFGSEEQKREWLPKLSKTHIS